ncbi:MAG: squalene--hopene cyclase [Rhizobiales bacterium]|nr:squalene--hopene cyclase [Hyphomicrobiales bacterium]
MKFIPEFGQGSIMTIHFKDVDTVVHTQRAALLAEQKADGHFVFELEADTTIPSEYVLLRHFLGEIDAPREEKIALYLRSHQNEDGSWPLFYGGAGNISASVKAYWALKLIGDDVDSEHMKRGRDWILSQGGAATANVFTRIAMALFGQVPWRAVPVMPVQMMLQPVWSPFHISKMSYWARTVLVPLLVLFAKKAQGANPTGRNIRELFTVPPEQQKVYNVNHTGSAWGNAFLHLDKFLRKLEPNALRAGKQTAIDKAVEFFTERLNGEDGLGAIYPAIANTVMAYHALGYPADHPDMVTARSAVEKLFTERGEEIYYQPCLSPVWDTCLAAHAILESGDRDEPKLKAALDWLKDRQILDVKGDWAVRRPDVRPGGWAFQYENAYYPDVDDTAVVILAMSRQGSPDYAEAIERGCEWLLGMQSSSGGWGAFEPENEHFYFNHIPFADHGALLDPPTVDVTARCVGALSQVDRVRYMKAIRKGVDFIRREQEKDGSWYGRWGANYIYGTWSALVALKSAGEDMSQPYIQKAVVWLKAHQNSDGGWGEGLETYDPTCKGYNEGSTASQTAWALMALMSADAVEDSAVRKGITYLTHAPKDGARWDEKYWSGTGFPRVFYLKYHGYAAYFPLWAMARYQGLMASNDRSVKWGI